MTLIHLCGLGLCAFWIIMMRVSTNHQGLERRRDASNERLPSMQNLVINTSHWWFLLSRLDHHWNVGSRVIAFQILASHVLSPAATYQTRHQRGVSALVLHGEIQL